MTEICGGFKVGIQKKLVVTNCETNFSFNSVKTNVVASYNLQTNEITKVKAMYDIVCVKTKQSL